MTQWEEESQEQAKESEAHMLPLWGVPQKEGNGYH